MLVMTADEKEKDELLYRSYREVVGLDGYVHDTAQRSLLASSFLILAGVTVFGSALFLASKTSTNVRLLDADYIIFFIFVASISLGTFITLFAIFPSFNIPKKWKQTSPGVPKSIYFGFLIGKEKEKEWLEYASSTNANGFLSKSINDLPYETYLIAVKVKRRRRIVKLALSFFMSSSLVLLVMVLLLIVYVAYYVL